jgi:hypothetical protein
MKLSERFSSEAVTDSRKKTCQRWSQSRRADLIGTAALEHDPQLKVAPARSAQRVSEAILLKQQPNTRRLIKVRPSRFRG